MKVFFAIGNKKKKNFRLMKVKKEEKSRKKNVLTRISKRIIIFARSQNKERRMCQRPSNKFGYTHDLSYLCGEMQRIIKTEAL